MKRLSAPQAQLIEHLLDETKWVRINYRHGMLCPVMSEGKIHVYFHRSTVLSLDKKGMIVKVDSDTYVLSPNWK